MEGTHKKLPKVTRRVLLSFVFTCVCFSLSTHAQTEGIIIDFAHRLLDTLSVQTEGEGKHFLARNKISLTWNHLPATQLTTLKARLQNVSGYMIGRNEDIFRVEISTLDDKSLSMTFPADRELIQGTDKPAADSILFRHIKEMTDVETPPRERMYVPEAISNGLFLHRGNWFTTRRLCNDAYLISSDGVLRPVYDNAHPEESLQNLLQGITENQVRLKVRHRQYGYKTAMAEAPLNSIIDVLREGCEIYVASEETRGKRTGYVFFHCEALNYLHMLIIRLPKVIPLDSAIVLPADLYSYIPQQNIKALNLNKAFKQ